MKRICSFFAVLIILVTFLSSCSALDSIKMKLFIRAENGYNSDAQNILADYGSICDSVRIEYADGEFTDTSYDVYFRSDDIVVDFGSESYYVFYQNEWYSLYEDEHGKQCFAKIAVFDDGYDLLSSYGFTGYVFGADDQYDIKLTEKDDGSYIWENSCVIEDPGKATVTAYVNDNFECTKTVGLFYLEDGSLYSTTTHEFTFGAEKADPVSALVKALNEAGDKTRHLTFNAVENSSIKETFEADIPVGFYCSSVMPSEYLDEYGYITWYSDIELTQELLVADPYSDIVIFFDGSAKTATQG